MRNWMLTPAIVLSLVGATATTMLRTRSAPEQPRLVDGLGVHEDDLVIAGSTFRAQQLGPIGPKDPLASFALRWEDGPRPAAVQAWISGEPSAGPDVETLSFDQSGTRLVTLEVPPFFDLTYARLWLDVTQEDGRHERGAFNLLA